MFGLLPRPDSVADLRRQTRELRASRARIVAAADAERRRIECDLHDGAQQHLTSLSVRLLMAAKLAGQDPELASLLEQLGAEVRDTAQELRSLAHGIYPPLLRANGLADALFAAASHATLPTMVQAGSAGRYPADVEAAVYFCCLEAMQNACKHAGEQATIRLRVREEAGTLTFEVTDDGAGFDAAGFDAAGFDAAGRGLGAGLLNMADRLGAFGGRLRVDSAPGRGTRVTGTVAVPASPDATAGDRLRAPAPGTVVHAGHGDSTTIGAEAPHLDEWIARGH
jgi:signal transduction histidine kinase